MLATACARSPASTYSSARLLHQARCSSRVNAFPLCFRSPVECRQWPEVAEIWQLKARRSNGCGVHAPFVDGFAQMTIDAALSRVRQPRRAPLFGNCWANPMSAHRGERQFVWGFRCCLWASRRRQRSAAATGGAKRVILPRSAWPPSLRPRSGPRWGKQGPTPRSKLAGALSEPSMRQMC